MLTGVLFGLLTACSSRHTPWPETPKEQLEEQVKRNQNAYLRYSQAEEEARRDGNTVAADKYREAKDNALAEFHKAEKALGQYATEHPGQVGTRQ